MSSGDWRSQRDVRADRYGGDPGSHPHDTTHGDNDGGGGGGGGRYNRARYRRRSTSPSNGGDHHTYPSSSSAFPADGNNNNSSDFYSHDHQRPRFENNMGGGYNPPPQQFMGGGGSVGAGMDNDMFGGTPYLNPQFAYPQHTQTFFNAPAATDMPFGNNQGNDGGAPGGMDPADLLQLLLQQQQQQQQQEQQHPFFDGPMSGMDAPFFDPQQQQQQQRHRQYNSRRRSDNRHNAFENNNNSGDAEERVPNSAPAAARVLPSVDEFVPVVPKSLLNLVRGGGVEGASGEGHDGGRLTGPAAGAGNADWNGADGATQGPNTGAMILLEAPKIAPEASDRGREQRRAHLSGFPPGTTPEELEDYFRVLLPEVRRLLTERQIRELAEKTGLIAEEGEDAVRHIPPTANLSSIDELRELTMNPGKSKPFSFIELRLADMIDELVEQCKMDPQRFLFTSAIDGRVYALLVRRPRDAHPLTGVEESKVVLIGFPLSMPETSIKPVFESYGDLVSFTVKNGYAYGEYADERDATDFRADIHGAVLGNSMVVALPLYDWLKVLLVREDVDITIAEDDPLSGSYVMKQVRERLPELPLGGAGTANPRGGGALGGDGNAAGGSTALVLAEDPAAASLQVMRELLDMSFSLPDMLVRFTALYPHLRSLYGNTQLTMYATPVLVLLNLFDEEELVFDATYSQLLADIEEEVEKYGRVKQLIVPRREARPKLPEAPKPGIDYDDDDDVEGKERATAAYQEAKKNFGAVLSQYMNRQTHPVWGGYGRVFVEYETLDEAVEAQQHIAGKLFGERTVVTSFLYPDLLREDGEDDEAGKGQEDDAEKAGDAMSDHDSEADVNDEKDEEETEEKSSHGAAAAPAEDGEREKSTSPASVHAEDID